MENNEITQGQIWEVTSDNFFTTGEERSSEHNRPVKLAIGEKIEIRYPYAWHLRTEDNFYFHATPDMIYQNCKLVGTIIEKVRFDNKASLEEILRLNLFKKTINS